MTPQDFTQFTVWKKAMDLAVLVHEATKVFPKTEQYALTSQMRKAAFSVTANIAEGFGRMTVPDKRHKYIQARGELIEVISAMHYSERVGYLPPKEKEKLLPLATEVHRMLNALIMKIQNRDINPIP